MSAPDINHALDAAGHHAMERIGLAGVLPQFWAYLLDALAPAAPSTGAAA
ncbi:hypothetical protein [Burkholderia ubonensis]|nr:hypothetical protein [Burkholderia ubonensis]